MNILTLKIVRAIFVILSLWPAIINSQGNEKGQNMSLKKILNGARLIMETNSGNVLIRPAREATPENVPAIQPSTTVRGLGGSNNRVKNNKKSKKSHGQMLQSDASGSRKPGSNKSSVLHGNPQEKHEKKLVQTSMGEHQQHSIKLEAKTKSSENAQTCRYAKSSWSVCDSITNIQTRILSLKKGDSNCLPTRTVQKKCRKTCRYEKGTWSECTNGQLTREDKLKVSEDGRQKNCNQVRKINKKCISKVDGAQTVGGTRPIKVRKQKVKGTRHTLVTA